MAIPSGPVPTVTVLATVLVAVLMTLTVSELQLVTYASLPLGVMATVGRSEAGWLPAYPAALWATAAPSHPQGASIR